MKNMDDIDEYCRRRNLSSQAINIIYRVIKYGEIKRSSWKYIGGVCGLKWDDEIEEWVEKDPIEDDEE